MAAVDGKWQATGEPLELPARSVMVAAGTNPNIIYEKEHPGTFVLDPGHQSFAMHRTLEEPDGSLRLERVPEGGIGFLTSYREDGRFISFFGDAHPVFAGNVVKAMASALVGYRERGPPVREGGGLPGPRGTARARERLGPLRRGAGGRPQGHGGGRDPAGRSHRGGDRPGAVPPRGDFRPGQFYRLQNYEGPGEVVEGIRLTMEALALTGAWTDPERGLISLIVLEMGGRRGCVACSSPARTWC